MLNNYIDTFKNAFNFEGRTSRRQFWSFVLVSLIVSIILDIVDGHSNFLSGLYALVVFIPNIAIGIRRMHDIGKSGWTLLWAFLPIIGWIYLLILEARIGDAGDNMYGADPLSGSVAAPTAAAPMASEASAPTEEAKSAPTSEVPTATENKSPENQA